MSKSETVTLSKARHDAVWRELNQLRQLRYMVGIMPGSPPDIEHQRNKCFMLEEETTQAGLREGFRQSECWCGATAQPCKRSHLGIKPKVDGVVAMATTLIFDEIIESARRKPRMYISTTPEKLSYDRMPHDFEAKRMNDEIEERLKIEANVFKRGFQHDEEVRLLFGKPLEEVFDIVQQHKDSEAITQAILRELEQLRLYATEVESSAAGGSFTPPPKREVTIQREPVRECEIIRRSARLRK